MEKKEEILRVRNLDISFETTAGVVNAVRGVNLTVNRGETVAIVGESGSGKSVSAKAIMGILAKNGTIDRGQITFSYYRNPEERVTREILQMKKEEIRRHINGKRIAMVFQDPMTSLNPLMPVGKQIMEGMIWHYHTPKEEAYKKALELMKLVGITDAEKRITGIEHGSLMDEESAEMFEQTGTYLVPTFSPFHEAIYPDPKKMAQKSPEFQRKLGIYQERMQKGRKIIVDSHIKLGYGTDFVAAYQNYESGMEFRCMMESSMDAFRILQAATKNNAEICEIDSITGTIEKGKYADIAGWKRDLLTDKDALRDCSFVMKEGTVYEAKSYLNVE